MLVPVSAIQASYEKNIICNNKIYNKFVCVNNLNEIK